MGFVAENMMKRQRRSRLKFCSPTVQHSSRSSSSSQYRMAARELARSSWGPGGRRGGEGEGRGRCAVHASGGGERAVHNACGWL